MNAKSSSRLTVVANVRAGGFKPAGDYFSGSTSDAGSLGALGSACGSLGGTFEVSGNSKDGYSYSCKR